MRKVVNIAVMGATVLLNGIGSSSAQAEELATVCWLTEKQSLVRFGVTQTGQGHFIYTGIFNDGDTEDSAHYAITGAVEVDVNGVLVGSFSGSKSTPQSFKTFVASVTVDAVTYAGSVELIRNKYDRQAGTTRVDYRSHTLTRVPCP